MNTDFRTGRFPNPVPAPKEDWVDRLAKGSIIWLVKEGQHAQVEWIWEPNPPNLTFGDLGICRIGRNWVGHCETWIVGIRGCGIDGKPLITPCLGQVSDKPLLPNSEIRKIYRQMASLKRRVERLEAKSGIHYGDWVADLARLVPHAHEDLKDANGDDEPDQKVLPPPQSIRYGWKLEIEKSDWMPDWVRQCLHEAATQTWSLDDLAARVNKINPPHGLSNGTHPIVAHRGGNYVGVYVANDDGSIWQGAKNGQRLAIFTPK